MYGQGEGGRPILTHGYNSVAIYCHDLQQGDIVVDELGSVSKIDAVIATFANHSHWTHWRDCQYSELHMCGSGT